jgi:hypothetical protein
MTRERRLGRLVLRILIAALCVAAVAASAGLLSGNFSDTDGKVIATSLLFALASATAAAGEAGRRRDRVLGVGTEAASLATFVLVSVVLWLDVDDDATLRICGILAIVALEGAHMCFVRSRQRPGDTPSVRTLTTLAMGLAVLSAAGGILPLAGLLPDDGDYRLYGEFLGVVLVAQLLCTALPPLVRRLRAGDDPPAVAVPTDSERLARELESVAERLKRLGADPRVRAESERLRGLARTLG